MTTLAELKALCKEHGCTVAAGRSDLSYRIEIDAPTGYSFSGTHCLVSSTSNANPAWIRDCQESALADLRSNLPHLVECPEDCECRDE